MFAGENVYLRTVELTDVQLILLWENNSKDWRFSDSEAPYSFYEIEEFVKNASQIRNTRQARFIISTIEGDRAVGIVDMFDIDFKHRRAGVGILIAEDDSRQKGYAYEALQLVEKYAHDFLELDQLHCIIQEDNEKSINLFEKLGYLRNGVKKNWFLYREKAIDAYFYQKIIVNE